MKHNCLCATSGCDFMSDEKEMREHFNSAHSDLPFANDSFIWLNHDMAAILGRAGVRKRAKIP